MASQPSPSELLQVVGIVRQFIEEAQKDGPLHFWGCALGVDHEEGIVNYPHVGWAEKCLYIKCADEEVAREVYRLLCKGFESMKSPHPGGTGVYMYKRKAQLD